MNKLITLILILGIFIPSISSASIDINLKYGQKNSAVFALQDFLADKGFLNSNPTGYFGLLTLKAVKQYQSLVKVPSTGFVGPLTRAEINKELELVSAEATEAEIAETGTSTPVATSTPHTIVYQTVFMVATSTPVVSQTNTTYTNATNTITTKKMDITISEPIVELTNKPNTPKYIIKFNISDNTKPIALTYEGTNQDGSKTKGGQTYDAGMPVVWYTDFASSLNYTINYNNGEFIKEGQFTVGL